MTACRSCGAPILWATTPGGRRIPLNPDPAPDGNVTLDTSSLRAVALFDDPNGDGPRYLSHFVTCPQAPQWRRK